MKFFKFNYKYINNFFYLFMENSKCDILFRINRFLNYSLCYNIIKSEFLFNKDSRIKKGILVLFNEGDII